MGMIAASKAQYENAIRKLFPQGGYWEGQFADPESDASLFIKAKAAELKRFRERMGALLDESMPESTTELISDWERVLLDSVFSNLDLNQRRLQLRTRDGLRLNRAELQKIAAMFGLNIQDVAIPYRPRCFGFAKFGQERVGSILTFSVLRIVVTEAGLEAKHWPAIKAELDKCRFARMRYALDRMAYCPIADNLLAANFFKRYERALLDGYLAREKPYCEFEEAVRNILLANHIPIFYYRGE
jgi:hypothetical protein